MMRIPIAAFRVVLLGVACAVMVSGCVVMFGGAALGGAIVATDRRSMGIQLEDAEIEHRINHAFVDRFARESVRIDVTSYSQKVLLAGQVPSEKDRADAESLASASQNVRQVINELTIGSLAGLSSGTADELLAGKVRAALLEEPGLKTGTVKVTCTNGAIYLFGLVSDAEAEVAKRAASHVNDVKRVVALFDLVSDASVQQEKRDEPAAPAAAQTAPPAGTAP